MGSVATLESKSVLRCSVCDVYLISSNLISDILRSFTMLKVI